MVILAAVAIMGLLKFLAALAVYQVLPIVATYQACI